jgi:hypothetical protein
VTPKPEDDDRRDWDRAWASQKLRRLATPARIDVRPVSEWGEPTEVQIVEAPREFSDGLNAQSQICPVCGRTTSSEIRQLVSVLPTFSNGLSVGVIAWAHVDCLAACEELPGPAPIPW